MALLNQVRTVCERLVDCGWNTVLKLHGLELETAVRYDDIGLADALVAPLQVDRNVPGFRDFTKAGNQAITPGNPAASLLYHAMASPLVHPDGTSTAANPEAYPSIEDLDIVENYIYSQRKPDLSSLRNPVIAIFAYQYRTASGSPHGQHADFAFSRCGVARTGTAPTAYNQACRHFESSGENGVIRALPSRFAAFIGEYRWPLNTDVILSRQSGDQHRMFAMPIHKLFPGDECLEGTKLSIGFQEYHRNEKLKRIHTRGGVRVVDGFDINVFPFVRDSENSGDLVRLEMQGASVIVVPVDHPKLVRNAKQANSVSGKQEIVRFLVPPQTSNPNNRFSTSLMIPSNWTTGARHAPEYVNIRHKVEKTGGTLTVVDLKTLPSGQFEDTIKRGRFEAAHFVDDSCDGVLTAQIEGLSSSNGTADLTYLPAYSLVAAPDFMPLAHQIDIAAWSRLSRRNREQHFSQGEPDPLCEGREVPNLTLPLPGRSGTRAFDVDDKTVVAIVGLPALSEGQASVGVAKPIVSYLTDAAADVFAPGWDVSIDDEKGIRYYTSHGLGSPFPEDAKLCAALNSYWPAAAPDASRTFGFQYSPTAIPMLDNELGYHRDNPQVRARHVKASIGWDGEVGPFFEQVNGETYVNFASVDRSDYVTNSLDGTLNCKEIHPVTSDDVIERMEALQACIFSLPPSNDFVANTRLWLVRAEYVDDWSKHSTKASTSLTGSGYIYEFGLVKTEPYRDNDPVPNDVSRLRYQISNKYECHLSSSLLFFRGKGDTSWTQITR